MVLMGQETESQSVLKFATVKQAENVTSKLKKMRFNILLNYFINTDGVLTVLRNTRIGTANIVRIEFSVKIVGSHLSSVYKLL